MNQMPTRKGMPLSLLAGGGALLACTATLAATVGALLAASARPVQLVAPMAAALSVSVACGTVAGLGGRRLGRGLRGLYQPAAAQPATRRPRMPLRAAAEMAEVAGTLAGLRARLRVAEQAADRDRRRADTATVGVYTLLAGLVRAEEAARGQLAAELHDTVAQSLAAVRALLDGQPDPGQVRRAAGLVADAEEQVRALMSRTRPPELHDGDLAGAVATLRDEMTARYGLAVSVHWPELPVPLPLATATTLYRFFQEGLLNTVKHAEVDRAELALRVTDQEVLATVDDGGAGFDPDRIRPRRGRHVGLGLLGERARLAGGALQVTSAPGAGTRLLLRLPRLATVAGAAAAEPVEQVGLPLTG